MLSIISLIKKTINGCSSVCTGKKIPSFQNILNNKAGLRGFIEGLRPRRSVLNPVQDIIKIVKFATLFSERNPK